MDMLQLSCIQIVVALLLFTQTKSSIQTSADPKDTTISCTANERSALLAFRAGLSDPANLLSSWKGDDCCQWKGVRCSNTTGLVVKLDLQGPDCENSDTSPQTLGGNINPSLLGLHHLQYLDLSCNNFSGARIPEFLGSLQNLRHLNLSLSNFVGRIPPQLGNLSNLRHLDLSQSDFAGRIPPQLGNLSNLRYFSLAQDYYIYSTDISWLSRLSSLEHLDMNSVDLSAILNWVSVVNMLPSLKVLRLVMCQLSSSPDSLPYCNLTSLETLDISVNSLQTRITPNWFWDLTSLKHLDISRNEFSGPFPNEIGNMTSIVELELSDNNLVGMIPSTMKNLCYLEELFLSENNINGSITEFLHRLPSCSWNKLQTLSLSFSNLTGSLPTKLEPLSNLTSLYLSGNKLTGPVPLWIGNMTSMAVLDLSGNNLVGMIPSTMKNLCNLEVLSLLDNNISGSITEFFQCLPSCSWNKLQTLSLRYSNLTGSLPTKLEPLSNLTGSLPTKLEPLSNLTWLDLSWNKLTGPVPLSIGKLTKLTELDLSCNMLTGPVPLSIGKLTKLTGLYLSNNMLTGPVPLSIGKLTKLTVLDLGSNNLDGVIHEGHLTGLLSLKGLALSDNSITITVSSTWVPHFSLVFVELRSCFLGPKFPMWLRWQTSVYNLDISNTSISDMVPDWFWIMASSVDTLNIQNNRISGVLPTTMEFMRATAMDLSSNQFSGPLPKLPINLTDLDLSRNNLSGPLPLDFGAPGLERLVLFDNSISGPIPSLCKLQFLHLVDISGNKLTGSIPDCSVNTSTTNVTRLGIRNLSLRNNNLSGEFPSFLQNCQRLVFLDLANNQFFGTLPAWIGEKLLSLAFLRLRSNMFSGHIPVELTKLVNLQYLDLAYNNISGSISKSIINWKEMILTRDMHEWDDRFQGAFNSGISHYTENFTVVTKGQERLYTGEIIYMVNLDLSCNNLVGEIPEEIGSLVALKNLNLSWNAFSGKIPEKIGALVQVESLDLSHNELSGQIPTSISALTSLSRLNLSYNNLTGKIPSGNQLQTLDDQASIYIGNPGLCGPPLSQNCSETGLVPATPEYHEDGFFFFLAMGIGYVIGLWVVFCVFLFKRKWRIVCFSFYDSLYDRVYVQVAVSWASLTRKMGRS